MRVRVAPLTGAALLAVLLAVVASGCGGNSGNGAGGPPQVLTSTGLLAEFATRVAGEDARVTSLIPPGVDLHDFDPPVDVARRVAGADLLIVNGYRLEQSLLPVIAQNRRSSTPLVAAAEGLDPIGGERATGEAVATAVADPHLWMDVAHAQHYVQRIADALAQVDAAHADGYRARAGALIAELQALDGELRTTLGAIPAARRKIVAFHDAFQYFARAYGFHLAAAVLPASPSQQPSAGDVARIVRLVRDEQVPAVYAEPEYSTQLLQTVAGETGARVLTLYDVPTGGAINSYSAMMRANARALVEGLAAP